MITDRDLDKSEAEQLAKTLTAMGIEAIAKCIGDRWVVIGTIDDLSKYCIASRKDYDSVMFRLNEAGNKAIYYVMHNKGD